MAYRFTNTEKWNDAWFSDLTQLEMLLFLYLCDNCDIAGFMELNIKRWASDLNSSTETINKALVGIKKGIIISNINDSLFIKNYIKHQKNLPLNEKNKAHIGILRRFELYSYKFDIQNVNEFIEGASKGLQSPTGNGIGNGIGNGKKILKQFEISIEFYQTEITKLPEQETQLSKQYKAYVLFVTGKSDNYKSIPEHYLNIKEQLSFNQFTKLKELEKDLNVSGLFNSKVKVLINNIKYCKDKQTIYLTIMDYMKKK